MELKEFTPTRNEMDNCPNTIHADLISVAALMSLPKGKLHYKTLTSLMQSKPINTFLNHIRRSPINILSKICYDRY